LQINRLLLVDDLLLLASSHQGLQHALHPFSDACDQARMEIKTKKTEVLCQSRYPNQCVLQASGNILQQVEKFKYFRVEFIRDGRRKGRWKHGLGKQSQLGVRELSNTAKLSVFE